MNKFVAMFKRYGWTVEQLGDNSFIAYNTDFFVPFSCIPCGRTQNEYISAVSYLRCDKDPFIAAWKKWNKNCFRHEIDIGTYAFKMYFEGNNEFIQFGALANHDHSGFEVEQWLEKLNKRKKELNNG